MDYTFMYGFTFARLQQSFIQTIKITVIIIPSTIQLYGLGIKCSNRSIYIVYHFRLYLNYNLG